MKKMLVLPVSLLLLTSCSNPPADKKEVNAPPANADTSHYVPSATSQSAPPSQDTVVKRSNK